ncbi:hypothetical protein [Marinicella sp. W31]|uniref:hypothetical protein n=1 Tax=Marinicella sp. W31 TaxID=3023713 RepID=UPI003757CFFF
MKTILMLGLIGLTSIAFAQDAKQLKEIALKACDTQMEQVPAEMRDRAVKTCKCTVNKTDYEALLTAQKAGNMEKIQADATAVAMECAKEM